VQNVADATKHADKREWWAAEAHQSYLICHLLLQLCQFFKLKIIYYFWNDAMPNKI
jgi:hypothetical protein